MLDDLWGTLISVVVGAVLAYGATWFRDWRYDRRTRAVIREALAEEISTNLEVLDSYESTFRQGLTDPDDSPILRWPTGDLRNAMLAQCLDPAVGALLTRGEQGKVTVVYYHIAHLRDQMKEAREDIRAGRSNPKVEYENILIRYLPAVAQNQVDFLCQIMDHQDAYASSRLMEISEKMLPTFSQSGRRPPRLWRTSLVPRASAFSPDESMLIVWHNDRPDLVPQGIEVVEIRPTRDQDFTFDLGGRQATWIREQFQRWMRKRRVRTASEGVQRELNSGR
jgi:hypothetical protein